MQSISIELIDSLYFVLEADKLSALIRELRPEFIELVQTFFRCMKTFCEGSVATNCKSEPNRGAIG